MSTTLKVLLNIAGILILVPIIAYTLLGYADTILDIIDDLSELRSKHNTSDKDKLDSGKDKDEEGES